MKRLAVALAVVLALTSVRAARADEPIVLKFSHVVAPSTPKGKAAEKFKARPKPLPSLFGILFRP